MKMPYERLAMRGDRMPDNLPEEDQLCFQSLAYLYSRYRCGYISRENGEIEARMIRRQCESQKKASEFGEKCREHSVRLWRDIEQSVMDYQKNRTTESADKLLMAIYGVGFPRQEEQDD